MINKNCYCGYILIDCKSFTCDNVLLLSELFDTTIDYFLTGNKKEGVPLNNIRLIERFQALEFFLEDLEVVIKLIDAMIVKHQVEGVVKPHMNK